jgi:hypothetical protein
MPLPTLSDAIEHLRQDAGLDDVKIQMCLDAATQLALDFLDLFPGCASSSSVSSSDVINDLPESVSHAILMITEHLYDNRSTSAMFGVGQAKILSPGSTEWMLLYPHRRVGV